MEIYLVGGAVRDQLLGRPVTDRDYVVVGATPQEMLDQGFRPVGADFPVFLHPETHCEYALARTERKTAPGYRGFVIHAATDVTLIDDLRRRDLTINAMARAANGELIDPYGGVDDLRAGVLRHVSEAFVEDPVRVLRIARFAARFDFQVAPATRALMQSMVAGGALDSLVPERVFTELDRALAEPYPWRFVEVLRDCGALRAQFAVLDRLFGVPQSPRYHPEIDTGTHVLLALRAAAALSPLARVRFAVLVHDLGKGLTPPAEWPHHRRHEQRGVPLVQDFCRRLRVPREYQALAVLVTRYHLLAHRAFALRPPTLVRVIEAADGFRQPRRWQEFLLACAADARGRGGARDAAYPQARYLEAVHAATAAVHGETVAAGRHGAEIGAALRCARIQRAAQVRREADLYNH